MTATMPAARTLTVVTVVRNGAAHIAGTAESVLGQDYAALEYVVIDGASTDDTLDALEPFRARIARVVSEPDRGLYDAMNKGLRLATGEFVIFMNCGDSFASPTAVTQVMDDIVQANDAGDQVVFARWIRRVRGRPGRACAPDLGSGLFNHQAVVYSRAIHRWHGDYLDIRGLSTADYLFFATLLDSPRVRCRTSAALLAVVDVDGVSAGLQTFSQKHATDYLAGRSSRLRLAAVLLLHPIYSTLKRWLRVRR